MRKTIKSKPANQPKKTTTKIQVDGYAVEIQVRKITAKMAHELSVTGVSDARYNEIVDDCNQFETFANGMDAGWLLVDGADMGDLIPLVGERPAPTRWETLKPGKHYLAITDLWKGTLLELTTDKPFDRSLLSMEWVAYEMPDESFSTLADVSYDGQEWSPETWHKSRDVVVYYPSGESREVVCTE
jgi:hypothetical protein